MIATTPNNIQCYANAPQALHNQPIEKEAAPQYTYHDTINDVDVYTENCNYLDLLYQKTFYYDFQTGNCEDHCNGYHFDDGNMMHCDSTCFGMYTDYFDKYSTQIPLATYNTECVARCPEGYVIEAIAANQIDCVVPNWDLRLDMVNLTVVFEFTGPEPVVYYSESCMIIAAAVVLDQAPLLNMEGICVMDCQEPLVYYEDSDGEKHCSTSCTKLGDLIDETLYRSLSFECVDAADDVMLVLNDLSDVITAPSCNLIASRYDYMVLYNYEGSCYEICPQPLVQFLDGAEYLCDDTCDLIGAIAGTTLYDTQGTCFEVCAGVVYETADDLKCGASCAELSAYYDAGVLYDNLGLCEVACNGDLSYTS